MDICCAKGWFALFVHITRHAGKANPRHYSAAAGFATARQPTARQQKGRFMLGGVGCASLFQEWPVLLFLCWGRPRVLPILGIRVTLPSCGRTTVDNRGGPLLDIKVSPSFSPCPDASAFALRFGHRDTRQSFPSSLTYSCLSLFIYFLPFIPFVPLRAASPCLCLLLPLFSFTLLLFFVFHTLLSDFAHVS